MSYSGRLNKIIDKMNTIGFDKSAVKLSEVKEAMFGNVPNYSGNVRRPTRHGEKNLGRPTPSDPSEHPYTKGEFVIELNPTTMKEELMMWDGNRLIPKKELENMIGRGVMREERIVSQCAKSSPGIKKHMGPLLELAKSKRVLFPMRRLSYITDYLDKRGYTLIVKKLKTAMEEYRIAMADSEVHTIPSIEKVYEDSDSPADFDQDIKRLKGVHEKITDIVEEFEKDYKSEVIEKVLSKELSEDDAVKKTVDLVNKADRSSDFQADKLSK